MKIDITKFDKLSQQIENTCIDDTPLRNAVPAGANAAVTAITNKCLQGSFVQSISF